MNLLLDRRSHDLVADALADRPAVNVLVMEDDERIVDATGQEVSEPAPEAGWFSSSLLLNPDAPIRAYLKTLLAAGTTRWVQSGAAGYEHPLFQRILDAGIRLSINDATRIAIAEYVLAEVLACFQPIRQRDALQREQRWERLPFRELHGSRWLIFGYGAIGRCVAERANAFGAEIVGVRRTPRDDAHALRVVGPDALDAELAEADVVVLCAAANDSNARVMNAERLGRMREDSVLVNIARGSLVDEDALLAALDAGRPGQAVLDVFDTEPLPEDHAFWAHPKVHLTAHCSAHTAGSTTRGTEVFLEHLDAWLAGEALRLEVTPGG